MALVKIKLPPGMFRNGTEYESSGRWYDGNLVRFENGRLKPIGGWQSMFGMGTAFTGLARGGISFEDNNGFPYVAIGTNTNLYVGEGLGGTFSDVTPGGFLPGQADSIQGAGYGSGPYGEGDYGTARDIASINLIAATWQFDTFGDTIVMCCTSDGNIYQFDPTTGLVTIPDGSPTCLAVMATNEDFLLALGAGGDGRSIQWPDIGTSTVWTPSDTNSAGSIDLNTQGRLMAGKRVGLQNLAWTNVDVHLINFIGGEGIYGPIRIGTACGLVGPKALTVAASAAGAGETAYWMSWGGFFLYNGAVTPLPCEVQDYIFANVNWTQSAKIYAEPNSLKNEIVWFFPSVNSIECDSYVLYNYKDNLWYFGIGSTLGARTMYIDRGVLPLPIAVDTGGVIYEHETGFLADGSTRVGQVFAQSGPAEIGEGDKVVYSNLMLPDADGLSALQMTAKTRFAPAGPLSTGTSVAMTPNSEGYTPVRIAGRQVALRFDITADTAWALGTSRLEVAAGGRR